MLQNQPRKIRWGHYASLFAYLGPGLALVNAAFYRLYDVIFSVGETADTIRTIVIGLGIVLFAAFMIMGMKHDRLVKRGKVSCPACAPPLEHVRELMRRNPVAAKKHHEAVSKLGWFLIVSMLFTLYLSFFHTGSLLTYCVWVFMGIYLIRRNLPSLQHHPMREHCPQC